MSDNVRVLKHTVPVDDQWHEIPDHQVVLVDSQGGPESVQVWTLDFEVDSDPRTTQVRVFGTGQPIPAGTVHLGSVLTLSGLVWHVFRSQRHLEVTP